MKSALPVDAIRNEVLAHWQNQGCLIQSPPGSGKTTRVPLWLLEATDQEILLLLPRRLPVQLAAHRLAVQLNETVGRTVGISLRDDTRRSSETRLNVTTYGAFLRRLTRDPELTGVSTVILDEFHERQLDQDTCLTLLHSCRSLFRPDLKLLFMSATLKMDWLHHSLGLPRVESDGQLHPLTLYYRPIGSIDWQSAVLKAIDTARPVIDGHLLVFLPGLRDIEAVATCLPEGTETFVVHSQVNNDDIIAQLQHSTSGVILSTNLAESSLTLPRVNCVIDLGLERYARVDPNTDLTELITRRISKSSADQRAGRAARTGPGHCIRLWSETEHNALAPDQPPDTTRADLKPMILHLADWGLSYQDAFWLTPPSPGRWQLALNQLQQWQALDATGTQLTEHGRKLIAIGLTPALAHLVSLAESTDDISNALWFAALISAEQRFSEPVTEWFLDQVRQREDRLTREALRLARSLGVTLNNDVRLLPDDLLVTALPQRLVQVDSAGTGRLASGRQLRMRERLPKAGWYLLLNGRDQGQFILAHGLWPLDESAVTATLAHTEVIRYRPDIDRFEAEHRVGPFLGKTGTAHPVLAQKVSAWKSYLAGTPLTAWPDRGSLEFWLNRYQLMLGQKANQWPGLPDSAMLADVSEPYLTTITRLTQLDTTEVLEAWLGYEESKQFYRLCPLWWTAPSNRRVRVYYDASENRIWADLKLQEAFGLARSPNLIDGQKTLTLNLRAPNGRLLASVTDLPHFWASIYPEIRKEMRGRYNKHPWPADPMKTPATQSTNRQLASKGKT